jgi:hypothetical protein
MLTTALAMIIIGCVVVAAVIHEMRNDEVSIMYELLFWMFVSLSVFFLLMKALI